jgi:exosortase A-associated hydrolase 1
MNACLAEQAVVFGCSGSQLVGILHSAYAGRSSPGTKLAIVVVVGGPQYRVGSHRQFVATARSLAAAGYPVFRFDYRGMGDSDGEPRTFEAVEDDIRAAIDVVQRRLPDYGIVLMGLCDAASAILMYDRVDVATRGVVLLNPWVRTELGLARAQMRHYYGARLMSAAFWSKLRRFDWDYRASIASLSATIARLLRRRPPIGGTTFVDRMRIGLAKLSVPALFVLSERDLTAREFEDLISSDPRWTRLLQQENVCVEHLPDADHTFSSRVSLDRFERVLLRWLDGLSGRTNRSETEARSSCR